jgi:hypothetical protein
MIRVVPNAPFRRCQLVGISLLALLTSPIVDRGQSSRTCDEGKPFTAQMVEQTVFSQPDGTERKVSSGGLWARDSGGRTYAELVLNTNGASPKTNIDRTLEGVGSFGRKGPAIHSMVSISNCHTGEDITIFPDLKNFRVEPSRGRRNRSASLYDSLTSGSRPDNGAIEDLGFKEIEGYVVHGYRETVTGTQDDGEWYGKIRWVMESWVSDDLIEVIQSTISNFKTKTTTTTMLTGIKRDEPPETLFEIPSGFTAQRPTDKMSPGANEPKDPN